MTLELIRLTQPLLDGQCLDLLASVTVKCIAETYQSIIPAEVLATETIELRKYSWAKLLANANNYCLIAKIDNELVGFLASGLDANLDGGFDSHIYSLYVLNAHKRKGIGKLLLRAALAHFQALGSQFTTIGVLAKNRQAIDFYCSQSAVLTKKTQYNWADIKLEQLIYSFDIRGTR